MLTVLVTMALLTIFVITSVAYATNNIAPSRRSQDSQAAVAAAQTGLDDYLSRLNNCDGYWSSPCPGSPPEVANGTWARVPTGDGRTITNPDGTPRAEYRYTVLATPATAPGLIRLRADGRVNGVTRTVTADLRKEGFLRYIYYTDKESVDPDLIARRSPARTITYSSTAEAKARWGPTYGDVETAAYQAIAPSEAAKCKPYWYNTPSQPGRNAGGETVWQLVYFYHGNGNYLGAQWVPHSCRIQFQGGDVLDGGVYTKDALLLASTTDAAGVVRDPLFRQGAETYWQLGSTPAPTAAKPWRVATPTSRPDPTGQAPRIATQDVSLPPSNAQIRDEVVLPGKTGCLYTGPTSIEFRADGRLNVTSPGTTTFSNANCGVGNNVAGPANGVIYVDPLPSAASCPANGKSLGVYPVAGDVTTYDCRAGDAFVRGVVNNRLTVATADRIVVTGDITYAGGTGATSDDVLGLVAGRGNVEIYHPVGCANGVSSTLTCVDEKYVNLAGTATNMTVHAAVLSVDHSFTVQNYDRGAALDTLNVVGGLYQAYRGPVGSIDGAGAVHGYKKNYVYDGRLPSLPPPSFLQPTSAPWEIVGFSEN